MRGDGEAANPSIPEKGRHAEPPTVEEPSANAVGDNPAGAQTPRSEPSELPEGVAQKAALPKPTVAGAERRWGAVVQRRHLPKPIRQYALRKLDDLSLQASEAHWRDRDGADNEETGLPAGESVLTPAVWITELYTPTTLSGLLDGLPELEAKKSRGVRHEEAAADWVRAARRSASLSTIAGLISLAVRISTVPPVCRVADSLAMWRDSTHGSPTLHLPVDLVDTGATLAQRCWRSDHVVVLEAVPNDRLAHALPMPSRGSVVKTQVTGFLTPGRR